jgi:N-acetylglucosamine-6-phosphate deacetylase
MNATAHLGNGQVIENSAIGFKDGKINPGCRCNTRKLASSHHTIDASGKHVYPGFIAPNLP